MNGQPTGNLTMAIILAGFAFGVVFECVSILGLHQSFVVVGIAYIYSTCSLPAVFADCPRVRGAALCIWATSFIKTFLAINIPHLSETFAGIDAIFCLYLNLLGCWYAVERIGFFEMALSLNSCTRRSSC